MGRLLLRAWVGAATACLFSAYPLMACAQSPTPVAQLDDNQMKGVWYEIARLPNKKEKTCVSDAFQLAARGDKPYSLEWVNSCKTRSAYENVHNVTAKAQDKKDPTGGRLKVTTLWPFTAKYWVLAVGPQYEWYLMGSPNHKDLWIYSRTQALAPDVLAQVESQATAEGYPVGKLVLGPQSKPGTTSPPTLMAP